VTAYHKGDKWGATINSKKRSFSKLLFCQFDTENEAKLAEFDLFTLGRVKLCVKFIQKLYFNRYNR
jgi:hypothetical protein